MRCIATMQRALYIIVRRAAHLLCDCRFPQRVYLPFTMSQHHWQRHTSTTSSSSSSIQQQASATAISRAEHLSSLLSGPRLGALPEFVAALDELTYPVQRLNAWKAVWGPVVNSVADKAHAKVPGELVRLWQQEIYPDLVTHHKLAAGTGVDGTTERSRRKFVQCKCCTGAHRRCKLDCGGW
jgi:hypothetical protein